MSLEELTRQVQENNRLLRETINMLEVKKVYTSREAASYLGISNFVLAGLREDGEIPFHMAGTHYRYKKNDLDNYLKTKGA